MADDSPKAPGLVAIEDQETHHADMLAAQIAALYKGLLHRAVPEELTIDAVLQAVDNWTAGGE